MNRTNDELTVARPDRRQSVLDRRTTFQPSGEPAQRDVLDDIEITRNPAFACDRDGIGKLCLGRSPASGGRVDYELIRQDVDGPVLSDKVHDVHGILPPRRVRDRFAALVTNRYGQEAHRLFTLVTSGITYPSSRPRGTTCPYAAVGIAVQFRFGSTWVEWGGLRDYLLTPVLPRGCR